MTKQQQNSAKSKTKKSPNFLIQSYLILYNVLQVLGWTYLLIQVVTYYIAPPKNNESLYETIKYTLIIFQNAAVLEILHAAFGFVKSSVFVTFQQVLSRVIVVCGLLMATPTARASPGLHLCLWAWGITEIIRYSFYALNILNMVPHFIVWLRYTLFIILYPIGITGELLCFYAAQQYVKETNMWTMEMPNLLNFTFSYRYLLLINMALYIPLFPPLYLHMFSQRKKVLGPEPSTKKQKSK